MRCHLHLESYFKSPKVLSLRERIEIQAIPDWPRAGDERYRAEVTVGVKDGRRLEKQSIWRRMTEGELDAKFSYLVGLRGGEAKAKELGQVLKGLGQVSNVAEVMAGLELPEAKLEDLPVG